MHIGRIIGAVDTLDARKGPVSAATRPDVAPSLYAAAVFRFEVVGLMCVVGLYVMSLYACLGDTMDPVVRRLDVRWR